MVLNMIKLCKNTYKSCKASPFTLEHFTLAGNESCLCNMQNSFQITDFPGQIAKVQFQVKKHFISVYIEYIYIGL